MKKPQWKTRQPRATCQVSPNTRTTTVWNLGLLTSSPIPHRDPLTTAIVGLRRGQTGRDSWARGVSDVAVGAQRSNSTSAASAAAEPAPSMSLGPWVVARGMSLSGKSSCRPAV
jgi:hypothetical protein